MIAADCSVDGCERPARPDLASGLCEMHYRRSLRGRPLDAPPQEKLPPVKRLEVAVIRVGDVDTSANDDRAYELAMECVKRAARRWMKANGWRPARRDGHHGSNGDAQKGRCEQRFQHRTQESQAAMAEGQIRQSGRAAEMGPRDARSNAGPCSGSYRQASRVVAINRSGNRDTRERGAARSGGTQAVQRRAGKARGDAQ